MTDIPTEDETFEALKKTPFRTVFLHCTQFVGAGEAVGILYQDYLSLNGWTIKEFQQEVFDRKIALSLNDLRDPKWRDKFRDGLIY